MMVIARKNAEILQKGEAEIRNTSYLRKTSQYNIVKRKREGRLFDKLCLKLLETNLPPLSQKVIKSSHKRHFSGVCLPFNKRNELNLKKKPNV